MHLFLLLPRPYIEEDYCQPHEKDGESNDFAKYRAYL